MRVTCRLSSAGPRKSKDEILLEIQGVDDVIGQLDLQIASLTEKSMSGQAEIFTNLKEAELPKGALGIYNANRWGWVATLWLWLWLAVVYSRWWGSMVVILWLQVGRWQPAAASHPAGACALFDG